MIGLLGFDHQRAGLELRGRLTFSGDSLKAGLLALRAAAAVEEVVLLSTCNRTEVYLATRDWDAARVEIQAFLETANAGSLTIPSGVKMGGLRTGVTGGADIPVATAAKVVSPELAAALYERTGQPVSHHLFRVAAGLESMVVGEPQILGQVKDALRAADAAGTVGEELRAVFVAAARAGKRVRTETAIGHANVSVAALAVRVAREALGGLRGKVALVVGAGKTSQLTARLLQAEGVGRLVLANRSVAAARKLAAEVGGEAIPLAEVPQKLMDAHLLVSATAAPQVILSAASVAAGMAGRRAPLVMIDLAVPPDVDSAVGLLPHVSLYTIDTLKLLDGAADETFTSTTPGDDVIAHAERILAEVEQDYVRSQTLRQAVPGIAALRRHVDHSEQAEMARALAQLAHLAPDDRAVVERLGQRLVDKMFHHLVSRIRSLAEYDEVPTQVTMQVLARLFADPDAEGE